MVNNISGVYEIDFNGITIGKLNVEDGGVRVKFDLRCSIPDERVYRLYCLCDGVWVSIGVALPDNDLLRLTKIISKTELLKSGLYMIEACLISDVSPKNDVKTDEISEKSKENLMDSTNEKQQKAEDKTVIHSSRWEKITNASALFDDEEVSCACTKLTDALQMEENGIHYLAVSADPEKPFPMMPVFCFGEEEQISGNRYIVFKIKNGKLC